jgi:hypothetical protein
MTTHYFIFNIKQPIFEIFKIVKYGFTYYDYLFTVVAVTELSACGRTMLINLHFFP